MDFAILLRPSPGRTSMDARPTYTLDPWRPVERMRSTPGGCGENFRRFRCPASRRKPVVCRRIKPRPSHAMGAVFHALETNVQISSSLRLSIAQTACAAGLRSPLPFASVVWPSACGIRNAALTHLKYQGGGSGIERDASTVTLSRDQARLRSRLGRPSRRSSATSDSRRDSCRRPCRAL